MVGLPEAHEGTPAGHPRRSARTAGVLVRLLPALLIVAGVVYELCTPQDLTGAPFFAAAPLVAAPLFPFGVTLRTGIAAIAATAGVHIRYALDAVAITEVATVATVAVLAVLINRLVSRAHARLASARGIAEAVQRAVLPEPAERIGTLWVAARYEAAQADALIGGDLYAAQDTPHGVRLIVGDVRGKGMGAVGAVAVAVGAFREAADQEATLEAVVQRLEHALARELTRREGVETVEGFVTALLAEIPHGDGVVRLLNRGHPGPLLLYADGSVRVLAAERPALPLGMGELASWPDDVQEEAFPPGATLLVHTDGLSEARDARDVFFDPARDLSGRVFAGPGALLDALVDDVRRHTGGGTTDDMALLAVRRP
ncbi:PP2C family protein-serine/threonine phosphatase [Streptomyces fructofermentans]|uniref:PP2C family protein-serine/threonine phosphatase n=1 Tax=Streptomyces fructofermentans TaxID=152141 RepID=UPI0033F3C08A